MCIPLHCNGLGGFLTSFSSHFYMESVSWLVLQLGGLEYWNTGWNICVRFVYSGGGGVFCSDMLLYIFPARFIHTFCWMEHVRRMEGVVYRFFSFCIVAFSKYMAYAFLVILIYFPSSDSGFLSIECYFDIQIHLASRQCSTKSRKKKVQIFKTQDPEAIYINLIRKFLAKPRNQKKPPNQIPSTQ